MQSCASDNYCNENTFWRLVNICSSWTGFGQYEKKNYANKKCWSNFQNFEIKIKPRRLGWLTSREIFKGHVDSRWVQGEGELKWMNLGIIPSINTSTKSGAPGFNNRHEMLKNNSAVYFRLSKMASYTSGRTGHRVIYYNWHQTICGVSLREPSVKNVFRKGFFQLTWTAWDTRSSCLSSGNGFIMPQNILRTCSADLLSENTLFKSAMLWSLEVLANVLQGNFIQQNRVCLTNCSLKVQ